MSEEKKKDRWDKADISFKILLPLVLGVVGVYANWIALDYQKSVDNQNQLQFKEEQEHKYLSMFMQNIYHEDKGRRKLARTLLPKLDKSVANQFIGELKEEVKKDLENNVIDRDENKQILSELSKSEQSIDRFKDLNKFKIGIYTLDGNEEHKKTAEKLERLLKGKNFTGTISIYEKDMKFYEQINKPDTNEIRYEADFEKDEADILLKELRSFNLGMDFQLQEVRNRTANFISIILEH